MPIAPAAAARPAFDTKLQVPRLTSAIAPLSGVPRSGVVKPLGSVGSVPQSFASPGRPWASVREPTSTSVSFAVCQDAGVGTPPAGRKPTCASDAGAPVAVTLSAGEKTWLLETAATEIASGAGVAAPRGPGRKPPRPLPAGGPGPPPAFP